MSEIPKEILDGGYPEDNEWETLNARDKFNTKYRAELTELKKAKQDLGNTALGAQETGRDLSKPEAESNLDEGEKEA